MKPAATTPTALVLVDVQQGFDHPTHWGTERSTPDFEANVTKLLAAARAHNASLTPQTHANTTTTATTTTTTTEPSRSSPSPPPPHPILIIHVQHHSRLPSSALHPSYRLPGSDTPAVAPSAYAAPAADGSEAVLVKHFNSSFVGTSLEARLRGFGARQLLLAGLTTDHCVSTTARMAANLQVLGDAGGVDGSGMGEEDDGDGAGAGGGSLNFGVVVLRDATATHDRGRFGAETMHETALASLDGEFAQVRTTEEVIREILGNIAK